MNENNLKKGLIFFPAFDWAISPSHPEREERLLYTRDQLMEEGILDFTDIIEYSAESTDYETILQTHFCLPDVESVIKDSHLISAGSAIKTAEEWHAGNIVRGFALVRPPGHHAMHITYGNRGFCSINNEAIMIEHMRRKYGYRKIAVVDTDVHHGDGTQDIFYDDPDVLYISFHQDGRTLYPGSGFVNERGGPNAYGKTVNIPLLPGSGDREMLYIIEKAVLPVLKDFAPEIIVNSAGQDNHFTDPLANMNVTAEGYGKITELLLPDILVLEGGYAADTALPYVNLAIILAMAGKDYSKVREPQLKNFRLSGDSRIFEYTQKLAETILTNWSADKAKVFPGKNGELSIEERMVYYDTDNLMDREKKSVRLCSSCGGMISCDTQLERGGSLGKIKCISIPLYACSSCRNEAYLLFENAKEKDYKYVFLQDKPKGQYLKWRKP